MTAPDWRRYLKFRCTGCGNCCRNTVVCITDGDIRRIVEGTGKSPRDFVRFYTHDEVAVAREDQLWVNFDTGRSVMGLRAVRDHCIFLDNETNRCTIYEHRPLTCRDYPFSITFSDTGAVEKISLRHIVKCPHEWDGDNSRRELKRIASWNERQEESYVKKVKAWNQKESGPKTRPEFLRFLGFDV
ncbi:MAG: YkgJ family cysteine cluster protein [Candidatus Binatia bacterium]